MFEQFTPAARETIVRAQEESVALGHNYIGTEHILLGLLDETGTARDTLESLGVTAEGIRTQARVVIGSRPPVRDALATIGIDLDEVRRRVEEAFGAGALERTRAGCRLIHPQFVPRAKKALELATKQAKELGDELVATEHLLLAVLELRESLAVQLLEREGLPPDRVRAAIMARLSERAQ